MQHPGYDADSCAVTRNNDCNRPTPNMLLGLGPAGVNSKGVLVSVTSDSGSTQTILHEDLAHQAGIQVRRTSTNIAMANGAGMAVVGEADIRVSYGKFVHETMALVSSDVRYSLLLPWHDLQFLDVLSRNFPASVSATVSDSLQNSILGEFPEVFKDTLSATPMNCPPMKIHLVEDYVPYCISNPRQVPLRFQ